MQLAVTFTVGHRVKYFEQVLDSWAAVRDKQDVVFNFSVEPSDWYQGDGGNAQRAADWIKTNKVVGRVYHNAEQFGVLRNPYVALSRSLGGYNDYAILAEDDLLVSDDIIEYHKWAANEYRDDKDIAMVCSFSDFLSDESLAQSVIKVRNFASVLVWGTWKDRWQEYIAPTWDLDYSTGDDEFPGGWDWNLNKRVLPSLYKGSVQPMVSRAQNIGEQGTHAAGPEFVTSPVFKLHRESSEWVKLGF